VKVVTRFPITPGTRKAIREQLLLDTAGNGVETSLLAAADAAKAPEHKTFVSRSYGPAGRLSVLIVDPVEPRDNSDRKNKRTALQEALGRVRLNG
jgi:hypothetical protein